MSDWIIETGIGETRAVLTDNGEIVEARVRRHDRLAAGAVVDAQLRTIAPRVTVAAESEELMLPRGAGGISEGAAMRVEVVREALGGAEPWKRALARQSEEAPCPAPPLAEGRESHIPDWDSLLEEARTGIVGFDGGELRIEATAAMTVIDVDGWLVPDKLAQMAAWAASRAIRRLDLGGSIGIDFPTIEGKAARQEIGEILDSYLPDDAERTAMNGYGFVQVVRPKRRASLIDLAADRAPFEARALLRRASRETGALELRAHPAVTNILNAHPDWIAALERKVGGRVGLKSAPGLAISAGDVKSL